MPLAASLRSKNRTPPHVRNAIASACKRFRLKRGVRYAVTVELFARWETASGGIRKRDGHNYIPALIDLVCAALGIDDSQIFDWRGPRKIHRDTSREYAVLHFDRC